MKRRATRRAHQKFGKKTRSSINAANKETRKCASILCTCKLTALISIFLFPKIPVPRVRFVFRGDSISAALLKIF